MPLLSESDRQTVRTHLAAITHRVTLLFFTQTFDAPETVTIARQVVDEVSSLSDATSSTTCFAIVTVSGAPNVWVKNSSVTSCVIAAR